MRNNTVLAKGNYALREGQYDASIRYYVKAMTENPVLRKYVSANFYLAKKKYIAKRQLDVKQNIAVVCWELAHNSAGRAHTLAMLYNTFTKVDLIGTIIPSFGKNVWEPIRDSSIAKHYFIVENESRFIEQAIDLVVTHPYDIVHLSKPRAPNIFIGILYKEIWGAKVLIDIDDEELAFVDEHDGCNMEEFIKNDEDWPKVCNLAGKKWTRLAVGMYKEFDGVTVSNVALQRRYGGMIIHHARDARDFNSSSMHKHLSRKKFNIKNEKKVVLFSGTPREHKGLLETAEAIASLNRKDIVYAIIGDFTDIVLKERLQEIRGVEYCFIGNIPYNSICSVNAIGDICVAFQDANSNVAQFQVPAKITDALAMGILVLTTKTESLAEFFKANAVISVTKESLAKSISDVLDNPKKYSQIRNNGFQYFKSTLEISNNANQLCKLLESIQSRASSSIIDIFANFYLWKSHDSNV